MTQKHGKWGGGAPPPRTPQSTGSPPSATDFNSVGRLLIQRKKDTPCGSCSFEDASQRNQRNPRCCPYWAPQLLPHAPTLLLPREKKKASMLSRCGFWCKGHAAQEDFSRMSANSKNLFLLKLALLKVLGKVSSGEFSFEVRVFLPAFAAGVVRLEPKTQATALRKGFAQNHHCMHIGSGLQPQI